MARKLIGKIKKRLGLYPSRFLVRQWSTPKSGPLAGAEAVEKGAKGEKSYELVDHFEEWTTGSGRGLLNHQPCSSKLFQAAYWPAMVPVTKAAVML